MFRNKSVDVHAFSMIPRAEIPRSSFRIQSTHKTTFDAGFLVPIYVDEVLPGDTFNLRMTAFGRLATPIFPVMDNMYLESFFFFVPCRLVWVNWKKFMGEQASPGDSISYLIPKVQVLSTNVVGGIMDHFGIPPVGQWTTETSDEVNALPLRAYNLIFNEWFRDENLVIPQNVPTNDGPDNSSNYALVRRGKRHDYFTSCLPWPLKGGTAVSLPLGGKAAVYGTNTIADMPGASLPLPAWTAFNATTGVGFGANLPLGMGTSGSSIVKTRSAALLSGSEVDVAFPAYADLSSATAATINEIRQAFQVQKLLERDARGGTRYTEIVRSHFGVTSPDARLQRPEYLGGGSTAININPVAQTSSTDAVSPQASLAGIGTTLASGHGFSQSFTEHGYIIGLVNVRADLTYQQGLRRLWRRDTRYDFYFPVFAALGEQAVLQSEIFATGNGIQDDVVFGYQERWAEYRYHPSMITGLFRSTSAGSIDPWHVAQEFVGAPVLNATFIRETPPVDRIVAVGAGANGQQLLLDCFFDVKAARPMPMYSVPGMIDHF